jgi:hypothetical protein
MSKIPENHENNSKWMSKEVFYLLHQTITVYTHKS